ncbi:MAG: GNAT family N-acetyltransferase [Simkaniaceae bacterium]|nr:GNAT family N-acetyltransferase [Simkaniaceae bacterium]
MQSLETKRMRLRPVLKSDSANLMKIFSDPIAMEFYPRTKDEVEANKWIKRSQNLYKEMGIGLLACELKKQRNF